MRISLEPITEKGSLRLAEAKAMMASNSLKWDLIWEVASSQEAVAFSPVAGPWLFAYPKGSPLKLVHRLSRWVNLNSDTDFTITVVQ